MTREDQEAIDRTLGEAYLRFGREGGELVKEAYLIAKQKYALLHEQAGPPTDEFTVNARLAAPGRRRRRGR